MATLEHLGREETSERNLLLIDADRADDIPLELPDTDRFVCLLAWDASGEGDDTVRDLARRLLEAGCVYVCCWGPDCSRVHDLFDEADVERAPDGPFAMSTWHEKESLAETLWFMLFNTYPDAAFFDECRSAVGISVGSPDWANEIRTAMANPRAFNMRLAEIE